MSLTIYVHLEKQIAGVTPNGRDHCLLARYCERLDEVAKEQRFKPISAFFSFDAAGLPIDLDFVGMEAFPMPPVQWFHPKEVAATVDRLVSALERDPSPFLRTKIEGRPDGLIEELRDVGELARTASAAGAGMRLTVGE